MTAFQIFVGFLLLLSWVGRPILYRPAAKYFPPKISSVFTSTWLLIGLFITFPLLGHLFYDNWRNVLLSPFTFIAIYKGVALFYMILLQQLINKESTSSSVFLSFIALAIGALINNILFLEGLGFIKVLCIFAFGILGTFFVIRGDAKRLSKQAQKAFIAVTLIMSSFVVSDHLTIPKIGWYPYLLVSSVTMFVMSALHGISKQDFKNMFLNKSIALAGIFYTATEFFVIYVSTNILPASIVAVFLRLSVPIVMIYSAIRYKEQNIKNQLVFGVCAIILAIPIILIK